MITESAYFVIFYFNQPRPLGTEGEYSGVPPID